MAHAGKLTQADDFRKVYRHGRRAGTRTVIVLVRRRDEDSAHGRIGVSAAKAVGAAVRRNRAKRRLREAVRPIAPTIRLDVDAILVATLATGEADFQEVVDNVRDGLRRAGGLA